MYSKKWITIPIHRSVKRNSCIDALLGFSLYERHPTFICQFQIQFNSPFICDCCLVSCWIFLFRAVFQITTLLIPLLSNCYTILCQEGLCRGNIIHLSLLKKKLELHRLVPMMISYTKYKRKKITTLGFLQARIGQIPL